MLQSWRRAEHVGLHERNVISRQIQGHEGRQLVHQVGSDNTKGVVSECEVCEVREVGERPARHGHDPVVRQLEVVQLAQVGESVVFNHVDLVVGQVEVLQAGAVAKSTSGDSCQFIIGQVKGGEALSTSDEGGRYSAFQEVRLHREALQGVQSPQRFFVELCGVQLVSGEVERHEMWQAHERLRVKQMQTIAGQIQILQLEESREGVRGKLLDVVVAQVQALQVLQDLQRVDGDGGELVIGQPQSGQSRFYAGEGIGGQRLEPRRGYDKPQELHVREAAPRDLPQAMDGHVQQGDAALRVQGLREQRQVLRSVRLAAAPHRVGHVAGARDAQHAAHVGARPAARDRRTLAGVDEGALLRGQERMRRRDSIAGRGGGGGGGGRGGGRNSPRS